MLDLKNVETFTYFNKPTFHLNLCRCKNSIKPNENCHRLSEVVICTALTESFDFLPLTDLL